MAEEIAQALDEAPSTGKAVAGTFFNPDPSAPNVAYEYVYTPFALGDDAPDRVVGWSRETDSTTERVQRVSDPSPLSGRERQG